MSDDLLSTKDVAKFLNCSQQQVRDLVAEKKIRHQRIANRILIHRAELTRLSEYLIPPQAQPT